tara:strand:- start:597 stop:1121 length:525 start_codon:yes stop_codon:yes gene_type:complete
MVGTWKEDQLVHLLVRTNFYRGPICKGERAKLMHEVKPMKGAHMDKITCPGCIYSTSYARIKKITLGLGRGWKKSTYGAIRDDVDVIEKEAREEIEKGVKGIVDLKREEVMTVEILRTKFALTTEQIETLDLLKQKVDKDGGIIFGQVLTDGYLVARWVSKEVTAKVGEVIKGG